jgi:hypothetical protein
MVGAIGVVLLVVVVVLVPAFLVRPRRFGDLGGLEGRDAPPDRSLTGRRRGVVDSGKPAAWQRFGPRSDDPFEPIPPRRLPPWAPSGPFALVAVVAGATSVQMAGMAIAVPADRRFVLPAVVAGAVVIVAAIRAVRHDGDVVWRRWPATTVGAWWVAIVMAGILGPFTGSAVVLAFGAAVLWLPVSALLVLCVLRSMFTNGPDVAVAILLVVGVVAGGRFDDVAFRLRGPGGRALAAEAAAIGAGPQPETDAVAGADAGPFVVAGTDRQVVAWQLPGWDTSIPVLVHDPAGWIDDEGRVGFAHDCRHVSGAWWRCSAG